MVNLEKLATKSPEGRERVKQLEARIQVRIAQMAAAKSAAQAK